MSAYLDLATGTLSVPALQLPPLTRLRRAARKAALRNCRVLPVMATPPAVSFATALPSSVSLAFQNTSPAVYAPGGITTYVESFRIIALSETAPLNNPQPQRVSFMADAQTIAFQTYDLAGGKYRVMVNDQYVSLAPMTNPTINGDYLVIDFTNAGGRAIRKITVEGSTLFGSIYVGPTEYIFPVEQEQMRVVLFGDSMGTGFGLGETNGIECLFDAYPWQIVDRLGITDLWNSSIAGTGYIATAGGIYPSVATRVTETISLLTPGSAPDLVMFCVGRDDVASPQAQLQPVIVSSITALRAALPGIPIMLFGIFATAIGSTTASQTVESAIRAAVAQVADPLVLFVPCDSDPSGPWFTGTGYTGATTNVGNGDVMVDTDGIHPTAYGYAYLAQRCVTGIINLLAEADA